MGRPSLAPGRYFRMLLLGYFEGLDSERAIAWRAADSLSLRQFLAVALAEAPLDHSTVSRTRRRIAIETHEAFFRGFYSGWPPPVCFAPSPSAAMRRRWKRTQRCRATLVALADCELRSYLSEPHRGRRRWRGKVAARAAVYANRREIRSALGSRLLRPRGERLERPNAHLYETGRLPRGHQRAHCNILNRLMHVCGLNLGLLTRQLTSGRLEASRAPPA